LLLSAASAPLAATRLQSLDFRWRDSLGGYSSCVDYKSIYCQSIPCQAKRRRGARGARAWRDGRRERCAVAEWRIDELAQRAGMAVDTIRYYQRERLLPPAERSGRTKRYGEEHLERLARIRELQSRRFSLAAIRTLLDSERPGFLEQLFTDADGVSFSLDDLVESA